MCTGSDTNFNPIKFFFRVIIAIIPIGDISYHKVLFTELSCDGMSDMLAVYRPSIGDHCFTFLNQIESLNELS